MKEFNFSKFFKDSSMWPILFSNLITIILAVYQNWNFLVVIWVYVFQSLVIGFFNFIRILSLDTSRNLKINKIFFGIFFLFHYSFFHLFYIIFLLVTSSFSALFGFGVDFNYILFLSSLFFISHLFSFFYNKNRDRNDLNPVIVMFYPYARIIPMHFIMILSFLLGYSALIVFLLLKTLADLIMHYFEHQVFRKS